MHEMHGIAEGRGVGGGREGMVKGEGKSRGLADLKHVSLRAELQTVLHVDTCRTRKKITGLPQ
jgi:hypothetical protein